MIKNSNENSYESTFPFMLKFQKKDGTITDKLPITIEGGGSEDSYFKVVDRWGLINLNKAKGGSVAYVEKESRLYMLAYEPYNDMNAWCAISEPRPVPPEPSQDMEIYTPEDLYNVRYNLNSNCILMNDIDLSAYPNWEPIGDKNNPFTGTLNGNGHTISNLNITDPKGSQVGLFGAIQKAVFTAVIHDVHIIGKIEFDTQEEYVSVGALAGAVNRGTVLNCSGEVDIKVNGSNYVYVGGLVATTEEDKDELDLYIVQSSAKGNLTATGDKVYVGGLSFMVNTIEYSSFEGNIHVTAKNMAATGGLTCLLFREIIHSFAKGNITIDTADTVVAAGGLSACGGFHITRSYTDMAINISNVTSAIYTGGLIGFLESNSFSNEIIIDNSYSRGNILVVDCYNEIYMSGMIGKADIPVVSVRGSYITTGLTEESGGKTFMGAISGSVPFENIFIDSTYWDKEITKQEHAYPDDISHDTFGKRTQEMMSQSTYEGWDFDYVWDIDEGKDYPTFR